MCKMAGYHVLSFAPDPGRWSPACAACTAALCCHLHLIPDDGHQHVQHKRLEDGHQGMQHGRRLRLTCRWSQEWYMGASLGRMSDPLFDRLTPFYVPVMEGSSMPTYALQPPPDTA